MGKQTKPWPPDTAAWGKFGAHFPVVSGFKCPCSYLSGLANTHCWKCGRAFDDQCLPIGPYVPGKGHSVVILPRK